MGVDIFHFEKTLWLPRGEMANWEARGIVTARDLNNYRAELIEHPLSISLGDAQLYVPSAPLSGPVLALILNILKGEPHTTALQGVVLSGQALRGD